MGVTRVTEGLLAVLAVFMHAAICNGSPEKGYSPLSFTHHLYNATIYENTAPKTYIESSIKMGIYITDPLWSIKYKLVSGDDDSLFKIEDYTVGDFSFLRIRTRSGNTASLNREVRDSYTLTIQSSESTYEYEARTKVVIRVLDANDLKPLFSPASYSVTVGEDTPLKSSVVKVRATDADLGSNAQFYYSFTRRSQMFVVNPSTGEIALAKKLNHTQASKYELVVLAEDRVKKIAGIRGYGNVARVVVNVEKVTPLPPVIKSVEVATPGEDRDLLYATVITEAGRQGLQVESVAVVAGDPLNYFKVMPSPLQSQVYQVVTAKKVNWLSYPFGFNLSLQAKDKSNPPLSSLIKKIHIPSPKSAVLKFEKEVYHVMLSEFSPPKSPVVQIKVTPNHANTSYHLASNQDNSKFKINPRSGLIVTTENMDYEKKSRFELDVMTAHGEAKARVVVDIIDENDNAPKFSQSSYKGTVSENEPIGTSILRVTAVDSDRGENGFITYAIANRGPLPFTIHPFTGVISTSEKLDYEMMQRWYHLRIWASDSGIPFSHVTESSVSIVMNNVNDNIPMFEKVGCNVTIPQSLSPGDRFGIMSAVDLDELQQVRYEIVSGNELGLFELNSVSGMLLLKKSIPLAYPGDVMPLYILKITATDGENYAQPTDINITVIDNNEPASMNCEDTGVFKKLAEKLIQSIKPKLPSQEEDTFSDIHIINHHSPKFDAALPRSLDIKEDTAVNSTILQFKASDQDSGFNGKLVYVIFDGSEDGTFIVDMDTGDLKVHAPLDRETTGFYILNITVYDLGTPQKSSWKLLAVNIIDANDNPPRFDQSSYFLTVPEDAAVETSIFQVKATDIDLEDNGRVQYSFLTSTDRFSINELTGVVRVTRQLDRETCPTYKLKIEARDQASADPQLFSTADLLVAVQDVNDNPPSFVPKIYKIQVPEDLPIGTLVLWVEGIDPDLGPAGEIIYNLVNNENRAFQLETSTGALSVEKELDFEKKPFYNLTVRAVDHGRPRALSSSCYVEVEVLDVNENLHTPRFSSFVFKGAVSEDASVGTSVIALTALDEDSGRDGEVRYFIKDGSGLGVFSIEAETGIIRIADTLDRESTPHYWLTVYATDLGSVPLVSWTEVFIEVMDVNDNPPVLSLPVYYASVLENSPKDMSILRVEASDPDFSSEGKLSFRITDTQRAFFTINPKTGVISSTALLLDREEREEHILEVVVDDNGSPPLQSTATVVIQVLDVNDQTPRFTHKLSTVRLPERHGVTEPEALYRMIAQDQDQGPNAEITYSLEEDSEKTKFTIHPGSGTVWSRSDFSPGEYSILTIKATDGGSPARSSTARLHIEWVPKPAPSSEPLAFDEPHFNFAVMETDPVTHMVGIISTDISQSLLWFDITGGDSEQEFDIEKNSGSIVIARPLNAGRRSNYNLTVRATDGTKAIKTQAYIRVVDINEHRPQFLKSKYEVRVPEDTPPWKEILQMSATDADGSNRLVYTIHSSVDPASLKLFQLKPSSGTLVTTATLDYETLSVHTLTVMVRDQEVPVKRNFVKVIVYVEDCNDHPPSFMSSRYEGSVLNLAAVGIEVVQVKAMDKDKGNNAEMIYTFHSGNTESAFSIDPESGKITVAKPLDQLSQERYHLTVKATDQGFPQLSDLTTVNIQVKLSDYTPPKFSMMEYFAEISEATHVGSPIITLSATSPTTVSYEIKDGNPNGTFQVNYYSGVLTVQKPLDFENVFSYRLRVRAASLAGSFAEAVVFVYVIDENDNAPVFLQSEFTGQISESVHLNSMVMGKKNTPLVIKATDADKESNALLVYKILEPEAQKYFRIEPSTGTLATAASIDFEVIPVFHFTVQVHDSGTPSLYADKPARVTVHVLNVNDCPPKFAEHLYESSLHLPAFFGMEVIKVTAVDADSDVTYSINEGNLHSAFTINPTTGLVSVNNASNLNPNYQLTVKASDGLYKDTALVKINVTDITTSGLGFEQKAYTASVLENSTAIQTLAVVRASGNYLNEPLFYSVLNPAGRFRIVQTSGVLQTTGVPFDREQKDLYDVVVQVRDTRRPPRVAHTHVKVYIEDINDNAPEFVNLPYSMAVQDDAEPGDVLFQVTAVDKDLGDNKAVVYSLADDFALFRIDPYLGDVSLRRPFDFETLNAYELAVIAADRGDPPMISEAELVITVRNKSNPIFQSLHYGLKVPENISPYTALLHIQARNPEGFRVIYNLVEENASRTFNIDFKSGILSVTDYLDYETQTQHVLTVRATDAVMGTFSEATVEIEVEDINDNPPLFQKTVYTAEVFEGSPIGTSVFQVHASDKDSGRNKDITYEINSKEFFDIDALSGQIVTTQELDYETIHQFHLKVKALDNGVPPMTSEALVIVNVSDVNDNPPEFTQPQYEATLSEMATCGQIVIKVQASDPDAVDANNLEYVIFSGNDDRHFAINKTSGIISFSNVCKRSLDPFYNLTVSVSDGVFKKSAPVNIDMMTANKHSPYFDQSIYEAELAENAEVGTQVIRLAAIDPDAGPYGSVDYTIINMFAEEKFSIDNKGQIVTSCTLDRENPTERVIAIKVMAKDGGGKVAFCTVKIILTDENDNTPQFKASEYHVSIHSNVSKGSPVIQIMAYDADEGTNADVTYFVDEAEEVTEEIIEINPFTGLVTIKESLVGLENKIFNFKVKARDGGSPHYNTSVPVQVQVVPSEVPLPRFSEPLYTFSAAEDLPTGSEIGSVRADANEPVIYSLVEGNTVESNKERVFALDKESGALVVQKNIDHEKTKWYQVDVMAHCNHNGTDVASLVSVSIQVQDVNDNQPVFEANPYKAFLVENMPAGTTVIQVTAIDPDTETNGEVTYRLEPETDDFSEVFTIDSESGWITSLKETDCESRGRYSFYVVATDHGGKVKLSSSALVEVTITDENDNPPQFTEDVYKGAVVENSQPGQVITALSTRDADVSEDNRQTTCYITDGDPLGQFSVEQVDGEWRVTLQGEIDREEKEKYLLRVTATDGRFQVTTAVEIHVLDINDNSPVCQQVLYTETVSEDAPAGFFILKVSAKDPDHGTNGQVTYTLHGPRADKFRLETQTGGLYTLAALDREQEMEYDLVVKATDGGGRSCQTDILLAIKDVNDNPPKFSSNHYVVTVFDNTTVKTPIAVIHAKDPDSGINSEVMYSLIDSAGDYFSVDEFSGILRLEKTLSDEPQSTFELKVKANDLGLPRYLTSVATVTVNVVDLSDYLPVFLHSEYTTAIPEGSALGAEVLSVSALTRDGAQNAVILYDIISGNEHGKFSIDSKTGLLSVNGTLDFEQCNEYYLSVEGVRGGSSSLSDITMVIINITDINDNLPRFSHAVYSTEVAEDISLGSAVIVVSADDLDGPLNNQIRYSIESGDPQQHFSIDPESGEIRLSRHLDREELSSFTLKVRAEDNGAPPQFSIATVTVKVSDVNDNPPVFFQLNYSLLIQEGSPVGSSVLRLMVTDRDTPQNGPPFSFRITAGDSGKEFQIDSEGLLTSVAILRRRTKEEYLLQVQVTDSGYPPLSSSTFIKISIIEQSQYPPSAVPLEIFITTANEVFSGRVLGKIHATDQDLHDVLSYKLLSESPPNHSFTVSAADGKIIARDLLEPGQYTLNVSVTDGKFTTPAAVHISVWGATQHALEQGVTLKLAGMTPEEFIADHWRNLQRYLGNTLGVQRQGVHIASLQQEPNSKVLDVLLVLKQLDSPAAKAHLLTSMLPSSVQEIEELLGMQITNMKHGFCKGPSCPPAGCKSTVRMDAESVSTYATARISFITPQHVWEVVCSCNESAIRFSGNSYLQYQYLNTLKNNHLRLSLRLKTHQLQGMVMATNGTDTGALEVINGELKFEYSCGRTPPKTLGVRNVSVSDGRWHRVLLEVNGTVLRLSLNKIHSTSITLAAPCRLLQSQGSLVFGGLIQAPPADRSWQVQVQRGFRGCLDALELNGEAINSTAKAGVQMPGERKVSGIYQCCSQSESCTSDPCRNGGTCQDTSTGEFLCSCAPQYFGSRCEIADNPCLSNPCLHGRQCVPSSKGYLCNCPQPDTRNRCEDYVDVCHSSPCPSGFDCKTSNTTYHCTETLKIEISSDSQFGAREIIEIFAVVLGVLILVGVFVFSRKRYLRQKKHKPIDMHDPDSLFQPNVAKSMDWNDQDLPPIEMNAMPEPRNDLDQETALTLKGRGQPDFTLGGGQTQKQRGTVVCSVAPNLPPRPPSSSDNESILKNNWELEYDVYPGDPDYYCPPVIREYEIVEEPYPPPPLVDPHQVVQFAGFPFPLEHYDRRAPLPPRYSNQNLDDFLGPNGLSLAAPHCPNEYTAISYYPTERSEGLDNLAETGYRRLSMRLSVAQPSYADCGTSPQNVAPMRTPRSYEGSDMVESDYGSCEEVMF
ncbi:protocadherin Fat 2-like [Acipenser ruthenus]|uniref:protocadherin Fat 2-like n=1 Tax=Acipenser ruthenus TaxID=7906 RepID=UPI002740FF25|nr:protocadherin Fat 2-like [Acipenser ruthenus]